MKILVSNDDGYQSEGLNCLVGALESAGHKVVVVAPSVDQSGQGMAITLREFVEVEHVKDNVFAVSGTPVDCVNLAQTASFSEEFDLLVSGINNGRNLGDDTLYSGTVAATLEARHLPLPSIACSVDSPKPRHFKSAAKLIVKIIDSLGAFSKDDVDVLNVNFPDISLEEINGFELTKLSSRKLSLAPEEKKLNSKFSHYKIGGVGEFITTQNLDNQVGGGLRDDYRALEDGFVSITPLKAQLTQPDLNSNILEKLNAGLR